MRKEFYEDWELPDDNFWLENSPLEHGSYEERIAASKLFYAKQNNLMDDYNNKTGFFRDKIVCVPVNITPYLTRSTKNKKVYKQLEEYSIISNNLWDKNIPTNNSFKLSEEKYKEVCEKFVDGVYINQVIMQYGYIDDGSTLQIAIKLEDFVKNNKPDKNGFIHFAIRRGYSKKYYTQREIY